MRLSADKKYGRFKYDAKPIKKEAPFLYKLSASLENSNIKSGEEIFKNPIANGDDLIVYFGMALDDNESKDCLSLGLTFSERKDDKLYY